MIGFCPLASGSKGNAIYLGSEKTKILIDAGISAKCCTERLKTLGVAIQDIDAICVTHEHHDHIQGLKVLAFKYGIPIIANSETAKAICETLHDCPNFKIFTTDEPFEFGDLTISPFSIRHDAVDPVAFTITAHDIKVGVCTDIGFVTPTVQHQLQQCNILYVEANHEEAFVHASSRPPIYKERVLSRTGHLSNTACAQLIHQVHHANLQQVYLAHLSSECNTPEKAVSVVSTLLEKHGITLPLTICAQEQNSQVTRF